MWYVIQTVTGKEEELLTFIRTMVQKSLYETCFLFRAEWMKRLGGQWQLQVQSLFPGYVFIETKNPEQVFLELRQIPKFSRLLGSDKSEFIPVREQEERFLRILAGAEQTGTGKSGTERSGAVSLDREPWEAIVRLTLVQTTEDGDIAAMRGALSYFKKEIVRVNLHKRYAVVRTRILGEERTLKFGIRIENADDSLEVF